MKLEKIKIGIADLEPICKVQCFNNACCHNLKDGSCNLKNILIGVGGDCLEMVKSPKASPGIDENAHYTFLHNRESWEGWSKKNYVPDEEPKEYPCIAEIRVWPDHSGEHGHFVYLETAEMMVRLLSRRVAHQGKEPPFRDVTVLVKGRPITEASIRAIAREEIEFSKVQSLNSSPRAIKDYVDSLQDGADSKDDIDRLDRRPHAGPY